jgi:hypothetical protein
MLPKDTTIPQFMVNRLLACLDRSVGPDACWEWPRYRDQDGYGKVIVGGRKTAAHRVAYRIFVGPIPADKIIRHSCDNPPCCNPAHLLCGTHLDNARDKVERGRACMGNHRGEHNGRAKLTPDDIREIRRTYTPRGDGSGAVLARRFGISRNHVWMIVNRRRWGHILD